MKSKEAAKKAVEPLQRAADETGTSITIESRGKSATVRPRSLLGLRVYPVKLTVAAEKSTVQFELPEGSEKEVAHAIKAALQTALLLGDEHEYPLKLLGMTVVEKRTQLNAEIGGHCEALLAMRIQADGMAQIVYTTFQETLGFEGDRDAADGG